MSKRWTVSTTPENISHAMALLIPMAQRAMEKIDEYEDDNVPVAAEVTHFVDSFLAFAKTGKVQRG